MALKLAPCLFVSLFVLSCGSAPKYQTRSGSPSGGISSGEADGSAEGASGENTEKETPKPKPDDGTDTDTDNGTEKPIPETPNMGELDCKNVVDECPVAGGVTWQCKKRFLHGVNYAWHTFGADFGGAPVYNQAGINASASAVDKELQDMKENGASVIRWWVIPDFRGAGVTFDADGSPTGLGATFKADLLKALELAEKHDLYLMMTMFSFDGFKPSRTENGAFIRGLQPIITDPVKRKALMDKVIAPMVELAEASPYKKRLMTWELINEPEWAMTGAGKYGDPAYECQSGTFQCVTHEQMETFLADLAKVVRAKSKALVSVGGAAIKWKSAWSKLDLDYYQYHFYDWVNLYYPYTKSPKDWGVTDKPVVMGEFPFGGVPGADATKLLDSWYGNGFGGALGWAVTDPGFNWKGNRAAIKGFVDKHSCETRY